MIRYAIVNVSKITFCVVILFERVSDNILTAVMCDFERFYVSFDIPNAL